MRTVVDFSLYSLVLPMHRMEHSDMKAEEFVKSFKRVFAICIAEYAPYSINILIDSSLSLIVSNYLRVIINTNTNTITRISIRILVFYSLSQSTCSTQLNQPTVTLFTFSTQQKEERSGNGRVTLSCSKKKKEKTMWHQQLSTVEWFLYAPPCTQHPVVCIHICLLD